MRQLFYLFCVVVFFSCSGKNENPDLEPPAVKFTAEADEYHVKTGKEILISAIVENAVKPVYCWKLDGKTLSTGLSFNFKSDEAGEYLLTFSVDAENGFVEKQVKVNVLPLVPPKITLPSAYAVFAGKPFKLGAKAQNAENATYIWKFNQQTISNSDTCLIIATTLGYQTLSLEIISEEGSDKQEFDVLVLPDSELQPRMFFDNGRYRTNGEEAVRLTVPSGKRIVLSPVLVNIELPAAFLWKMNGAAQSSTAEFLDFEPTEQGVYEFSVSLTQGSATVEARVSVECVKPEETFYRAVTDGNKAGASRVFEYIPAPGQFVDFGEGSTVEDACREIQAQLNSNATGWIASLGAYGGYLVVGFDHSINNVSGKADLKIPGNAFAGSSEPGVVWVMQDENGNGLPDDTWYELKGSETGKPATKQRYAITYYKPRAAASSVPWTDNYGQSGSVDYNRYHSQEWYFPGFISEKYTLCGTCLASNMVVGEMETTLSFPWGYVDNYNTATEKPMNEFWIEDAVQADGSPANLKYIDFVKIQTAVKGKGLAIGELSTETGIPVDLNFEK